MHKIYLVMKKYTENEILDRVQELETFKGWKKGMYDIWIRSKQDKFDRFDDVCYTFECCEDNFRPSLIHTSTGTTNAGSKGLLTFYTYNPKGCAILKSDTIVYKSHRYGKSKGRFVYRQSKPFPYYRDNNKNKKAEEYGKEYNNIIYAHTHDAGIHSKLIGGWSLACLVKNIKSQYSDWMKIMDKRPLSVCILKEF